MKIWALGDAVVDLLPAGDMNYQACAGGAPLNVAVGVARLAGDSAFIGRVGNDPFGRFLKRTLEEQGVGAEFMLTDETYRTSTVVVDLATSGERSFSFLVNPSADQFLTPVTCRYSVKISCIIVHWHWLLKIAVRRWFRPQAK